MSVDLDDANLTPSPPKLFVCESGVSPDDSSARDDSSLAVTAPVTAPLARTAPLTRTRTEHIYPTESEEHHTHLQEMLHMQSVLGM